MFRSLSSVGVIPVVAVESGDQAKRLCEALLAGELNVAEITFRTDAAEAAIREAVAAFPEMTIGAGTILTVDQLQRAIDAGAAFGVAPGCNSNILEAALERSFSFAPGVCTPSDVERAYELGITDLKFFPAEASGGIALLKALLGPYGHLDLSFCPFGGIKPANMQAYLALPQVDVVGGSWLAKKDMVAAGKWDDITALAKEAVDLAREVTSVD